MTPIRLGRSGDADQVTPIGFPPPGFGDSRPETLAAPAAVDTCDFDAKNRSPRGSSAVT